MCTSEQGLPSNFTIPYALNSGEVVFGTERGVYRYRADKDRFEPHPDFNLLTGKILEFVQPMYEQAKVEEVRNSPSVLILDKAYPPERKSKPKGSLYALVAFVASTLVGYFLIFTLVLFQKIKKSDPGNYSYITSSLGNDLAKFKLRGKKQLPDN